MYHKVRALYTRNKFGRNDIACVNFSKEDCFKLWQRELEENVSLDYEDEDDNLDRVFGASSISGSGDFVSLGDDGDLDALSDVDLFDVDKSGESAVDLSSLDKVTGEVSSLSGSESGEISDDSKSKLKKSFNPFIKK